MIHVDDDDGPPADPLDVSVAVLLLFVGAVIGAVAAIGISRIMG